MSAPKIESLTESQLQSLFYENYADLCRYAHTFLGSTQESEDIVQQVFLKFWEDFQRVPLPENPRAYLFKTVYNRSLNTLKHRSVQRKHAEYQIHHYWGNQNESTAESHMHTKELESALSKALGEMSETTRQTFILSRFHGLSHKEIAETLTFSSKNVEYHLRKAIQILKSRLSNHAITLLVFILHHLS